MKTHDVAKALRSLAAMLEAGNNTELAKTRLTAASGRELTTGEVAVSLSTLVELSRIDKKQWMGIVKELGFPIEIRARDASRDILGKLLNYLETNEAARERLRSKAAATKGVQASPELMRALSSLLKNDP